MKKAKGNAFATQRRPRARQNQLMERQNLSDEELGALATEWRGKALRGELHARGIAHEFESELRRRAGAPFTDYDTLDMRPIDARQPRRRWWRLWRR